jgi:hypothetical protein
MNVETQRHGGTENTMIKSLTSLGMNHTSFLHFSVSLFLCVKTYKVLFP